MSSQSNFGDNQFDIELKDERSFIAASADGLISTGCLVFVYDAGTKTLATIYSSGNRAAQANPITRTAFDLLGKIKFWGAAASYDIAVNDNKGNTAVHLAVAPSTHLLPLNRNGVEKCLVFPMAFNAGGTVVDTGLDLPAKAHVHDVAVEVVDTDSGETVDIGLLATESGGDEDGFIAAASVASAGFVKPFVITTGGNSAYVSSAKYGALMGPAQVGTDVDQDEGVARGWGHVGDGTAKSITYTPSGSDTFTGYGYVKFTQLR